MALAVAVSTLHVGLEARLTNHRLDQVLKTGPNGGSQSEKMSRRRSLGQATSFSQGHSRAMNGKGRRNGDWEPSIEETKTN